MGSKEEMSKDTWEVPAFLDSRAGREINPNLERHKTWQKMAKT